MTQILTCLTDDVVVMVADRRLTRATPDGRIEVVDDDAAKVVLLGQQVAVGYTGLANVRPPPRARTDWWLVDALSPPEATLDGTVEQLRVRATEVFGKMSHVGPRAKRHAFVAAGWSPSGGGVRPFYLTISNALSSYGFWLEKSTPEFVTHIEWLPQGTPFRFDATGQRAPAAVKQRVLAELSNPEGRAPSQIAANLTRAVRETAEKNDTVGEGLLVTVIPRDTASKTGGLVISTEESVDPYGQISFPEVDCPTSFYLPAKGKTGIVYAPHYMDENLRVAGAFALDRSFASDEEFEQYFDPLIERSLKEMP